MRAMSKPTNIHDSFFKNVLSDREAAGIFLREHLPREVADLLAPKLPELMPGSFVDEALGQHHTDLLFRIRLKTQQDALAYLLMEHKSSPDEATRLQLLRYIVRILTRWYKVSDARPRGGNHARFRSEVFRRRHCRRRGQSKDRRRG